MHGQMNFTFGKTMYKIISKRAGKNNLIQEVIGRLCSMFQIRIDTQIFAAPIDPYFNEMNQKLCFSVTTQEHVTTDSTQQSSFAWMRVAYIHTLHRSVCHTDNRMWNKS